VHFREVLGNVSTLVTADSVRGVRNIDIDTDKEFAQSDVVSTLATAISVTATSVHDDPLVDRKPASNGVSTLATANNAQRSRRPAVTRGEL